MMREATTGAAAGQETLPTWAPGLPLIGPMRSFLRDPLGHFVTPYQRFGPVFRTSFAGRASTVVAGPEGTRAILENPTSWSVGEPLRIFREQFSETYLTQMDGPPHRQKRQRMTPGFTMRVLSGEVAAMQDAADAVFAAARGQVTDLRGLCARLVAVTQARALLGADLPTEVEEEVASLERHLLGGGLLGPLRHGWYAWPGYRRRKQRLLDLFDRLSTERAEVCPVTDADDALAQDGLLARMVLCDARVPARERAEDLLMLLLAGSETTTAVILWAILLTATRPDWAAELDAELSGWDPGAFGRPEAWPKLAATIIETERLRPPFPLVSKQAEVDVDVAGRTVPAGTVVLQALTVAHFLPELYPDPQAFRPERFPDGTAPRPDRFTTFGVGPHVCLGMNLARLQEMTALAMTRTGWSVTATEPVDLTPRYGTVVLPASRSIPVSVASR